MPRHGTTYDVKEIGKRLRLIRICLHKTQREMSEELGISLSHYSKLEIGVGTMSHDLVLLVCNHFRIKEDWLVNGTGAEPAICKNPVSSSERMPHGRRLISPVMNKLLDILSLALNDDFRNQSDTAAKAMQIPLERAMAILIKERLRL